MSARPYMVDDGSQDSTDIPVEAQVGVALVLLGLSYPAEGTRDATRLLADLAKVGAQWASPSVTASIPTLEAAA